MVAESTTGVRSAMGESNSCRSRVWPSKDSAVVTNLLLPRILWWFCTVHSHIAWEYGKTAPSSELTTQRNTLLDNDRHQPEVSCISGQSFHVPTATEKHSISLQNKISPSPWMTMWSRSLQSHDSEGLKSPCTCSDLALLWAKGQLVSAHQIWRSQFRNGIDHTLGLSPACW